MVACLLAALVVGPALDFIVCKGESDIAASTAGPSDGQTVVSDNHDLSTPSQVGHDVDACVHGHCHHGLTLALLIADGAAAPMMVTPAHFLSAGSIPPSRTPSGLERPPRA